MSKIIDFISKIEEPQKSEMLNVYGLVKETVPDATDNIGYGMPVFKYKGKYLIGFSAFKDHLSIFPGPEPIEKFKTELTDFKTSKGTIQFTIEKPLPDKLLKDIITERVRLIEEKQNKNIVNLKPEN